MINYESPVFVSLVLYTIYALLLFAAGLTAWSVVRGLRLQGRLPHGRVAMGVGLLLVLTLTATWLLASTKPLNVNGKLFADVFWLRTSDMLIGTSVVLIVVAVASIVVSQIINRKS